MLRLLEVEPGHHVLDVGRGLRMDHRAARAPHAGPPGRSSASSACRTSREWGSANLARTSYDWASIRSATQGGASVVRRQARTTASSSPPMRPRCRPAARRPARRTTVGWRRGRGATMLLVVRPAGRGAQHGATVVPLRRSPQPSRPGTGAPAPGDREDDQADGQRAATRRHRRRRVATVGGRIRDGDEGGVHLCSFNAPVHRWRSSWCAGAVLVGVVLHDGVDALLDVDRPGRARRAPSGSRVSNCDVSRAAGMKCPGRLA